MESSVKDFITRHRHELVEMICTRIQQNAAFLDDEEIETWIYSDEMIHNWAVNEGVHV